MKAPKVSVIMPVFNGEQGIREAIDSILGQTYSDFEFLIVNDRSTDGSESIINEYARHDARIVLLHNGKEKGIGLGLTVVHKIAEDHGGTILVEKTGPDGTVFLVTLPIKAPELESSQPSLASSSDQRS